MSKSVFSSLETLNFKSMTLETIVKRIIDWTFTGGIKLINYQKDLLILRKKEM